MSAYSGNPMEWVKAQTLHSIIGITNMGYRITNVKFVNISLREIIVVGLDITKGKAVTWRAYNHSDSVLSGEWIFESGHYFTQPDSLETNWANAIRDYLER